MEKTFKAIAYVFAGIAICLFAMGALSFLLPDTSSVSILWNKLGKYLAFMFFLLALCLSLIVDNKRLFKKLNEVKK